MCISGGGVRAASFGAGVLWKLAELGALKHVDHLSCVSGGGYAGACTATSAGTGRPAVETPPPAVDTSALAAPFDDPWYARAALDVEYA